MAFRFSLAAVLLVRENAKKRAEHELNTVQLEIGRLTRHVEALNLDIANTHMTRERALQQPIPAGELHSFEHRLMTIAEARKKLLDQLHSLELERERRMKVYHLAHRDLETVIEMLNDQRAAHDQEQNRTEQKQLDDIFASRAGKDTNHN